LPVPLFFPAVFRFAPSRFAPPRVRGLDCTQLFCRLVSPKEVKKGPLQVNMDTIYTTLHTLCTSLPIAWVANSVLFFLPTWVLHTVLGKWLAGRRIRYDKPARQLTFAGLFSMDAQFKKEWLQAMEVAVGGLATVLLEKTLVKVGAIAALPTSDPADWGLIGRQFLVYFFLFDLYYYLLHRFFLHGPLGYSWCHKAHHDSYVCTPATGFSFHGFEGVITGGFNPLLAHLLGFDSRTVMVCQLYGITNTICVHAGIQIYPSWWDTNSVTKLYLSPQFHDVHHEKVRFLSCPRASVLVCVSVCLSSPRFTPVRLGPVLTRCRATTAVSPRCGTTSLGRSTTATTKRWLF